MKNIIKIKNIIEKEGVFIIAEAGCNHDGDLDIALDMVEKAAKAGAHAIKFQSFSLNTLFAKDEYTSVLNINKNSLDGVDDIIFKKEWYKSIKRASEKNNIIFFSTPFSLDGVDDMESFDMPLYKIASCDIDNIPLLRKVAETHKPVILSTGLAYNNDIKSALSILRKNEVALLHCSVEYPTPKDRARLNRIDVLKNIFRKHIIGFSDHTIGLEVSLAAVAKGARIIEKHFTVTPDKKTGDHLISLDPIGLEKLVNGITGVYSMLGGEKALKKEHILSEQEKKELIFAKRGLYLRRSMLIGEKIKESDLIALRPCVGIPVSKWNNLIGKTLKVDKKSFTRLCKKDFKR